MSSISDISDLLRRAEKLQQLSESEALCLWHEANTADLMITANRIRFTLNPEPKVGWIIDRNSNTTNVCIANCKFCNFYRIPGHKESYITDLADYRAKIEELLRLGGEQLLLQGGHHPDLGLQYYCELFGELKSEYPQLKLHALGPPEIAHIAKLEKISHREVLVELINAGLDSLPGAGAEILSNRVRRLISKGKCSGEEWLSIMHTAHQLNLTTSATMMFGHVETDIERIQHILAIREVQNKKPEKATGFISFIPWPFQDEGTLLKKLKRARNACTADEYIRTIALSRILLPNIPHIQASWLTVGQNVAQICLHAGADDFGSIMIEENVVSAAGASHRFDASGIQEAIRNAGFTPYLRDQQFRKRAYQPAPA